MIKLFKFKPAGNLPDPSPFCMKLETFLKMAELPYERIEANDPRKGPKGKLPFIRIDNRDIGDSSLIIEYLTASQNLDIDRNLSKKDEALGHCLTKTLEERFYWILVYSRWIDERCWPSVRSMLFDALPAPIRPVVAGIMRRSVKRDLYGQGLGRHSQDEIYQMGRYDLQAISDILGENSFILGRQPTRFDCSVHGFVASAIQFSLPTPLQEFGLSLPNLVDYNDRMNGLYYTS